MKEENRFFNTKWRRDIDEDRMVLAMAMQPPAKDIPRNMPKTLPNRFSLHNPINQMTVKVDSMALGKFNRHYLDMPPHKNGRPLDEKSFQNRLQDGHLRNIKPVNPIFYKDIGTDNAM